MKSAGKILMGRRMKINYVKLEGFEPAQYFLSLKVNIWFGWDFSLAPKVTEISHLNRGVQL